MRGKLSHAQFGVIRRSLNATRYKRIAAVFAGAAISATGAAGNDKLASTGDPPAYSSSYVSLNLPYVRYSSFAYLSLSYSSFLQYSSIYVPPWRP